MNRRIILCVVAVSGLMTLSGCGLLPQEVTVSTKPVNSPRNDRTFSKRAGTENVAAQNAIYTVLDQEKIAYIAGYRPLPPSAQPAEFVAFLTKYSTEQRKVDLSACPEAFQQAFDAYLTACEKVQAVLKPLPGQYAKSTFMDAMKSLSLGDPKPAEFLGGDVSQAMHELNTRFDQLYDVARENGIDVQ
jgi:hypothetical protein